MDYDDYKKSGNAVRCMAGRYGTYVLVDDLQKMLYKDALKLANDGKKTASSYAHRLADSIGDLKN